MTRPAPTSSARRRSRRRVTFGLLALFLLLGAVTSGLLLAGISAAWWVAAVQGGVLLLLLAGALRREPAAQPAIAAPAPAPEVSPVRALAFWLEESIERLRHQERQRYIAGEVSFEECSAREGVFLAARAEIEAPEARSPTQVSDDSARRARRWSFSEPLGLLLRKGRGHQASTFEEQWSAAQEQVQRLEQDYHAGVITWGQLDLGIDQVRDDVLAAVRQRANLPGALERMPTSSAPVPLTRSGRPAPVTPPEARPVPGAWVHWDYSPKEWARFDRMDWRMGWRVAKWLLIALPWCLFEAFVGFFWGGPLVIALVFAASLLFTFGFFLLSYFTDGDVRARHQARRRRDQPHRVTLSRDGVWVAGTHFPLGRLENVTMTDSPPVLHFRRSLPSGTGRERRPLSLLVPRGHEEEAARLMQRYHRDVIEPTKQLLERINAPPPEPR